MTKNNAKRVLKRIILGRNHSTIVTQDQSEVQKIYFSMSSIFPNKDAEDAVLELISKSNE